MIDIKAKIMLVTLDAHQAGILLLRPRRQPATNKDLDAGIVLVVRVEFLLQLGEGLGIDVAPSDSIDATFRYRSSMLPPRRWATPDS
jgi:hypothetical protein